VVSHARTGPGRVGQRRAAQRLRTARAAIVVTAAEPIARPVPGWTVALAEQPGDHDHRGEGTDRCVGGRPGENTEHRECDEHGEDQPLTQPEATFGAHRGDVSAPVTGRLCDDPAGMVEDRPFLERLAEDEREALLAAGRTRAWRRGEMLIRAGDAATSAIVLLDGLVKVHLTGSGGGEVVLGINGPGDLLGEVTATQTAAVRSANVTALQQVEGMVIALPELQAFLRTHAAVTLAMLDLALRRLRVADRRRLEFATAESLPRVTSRLVELAERFGTATATGAIDVGLPINQEELASWSASSRESTARALRTLRELKLIETHRMRFVVLDPERLRAHASRL
jgi:CRP/FNR family transcriptional regulator, cyclic AMP receptor protein